VPFTVRRMVTIAGDASGVGAGVAAGVGFGVA
jgi:hypothetical protein